MESKELYKTIYKIARVVNSSLEPREVLGQIVEQVTKAMNAKGCFIRLLDRSGTVLKPDAYYGLSERYAHKGTVEVAKSKLDQEALEGRPVYIEDVRTDHRFQYPQQASEEGIVSLLVVPLTAQGDKIIGVLRVYSGQARSFTDEEMDFLSCTANLCGIALENARMYHALKRTSELANEYVYQVFED
ncbi:putative GAF sensor protein [Desulfonatronospira thiodismutans ASO3-1]|uniref:GAF sensor protein n=1 Tax=Desulfonatronospira thiodismutans ASO3-1 TaxID=555779 RepID=D6SKM0_9BACT|nr:GAF domain-containing protein [Desulfonatronospira thiodismutans]EFI35231.1 putative GAF sensor protein [Desulfonatronospira thiodismutans ASO3-1]